MTSERIVDWTRPAPEEIPGDGVDLRRMVLAPEPQAHDPFILWGEDWFRRGAFDWHPHRGFQTASYVAEGEMELADSLGTIGRLKAGDVQWTNAGCGFFHDGQPVGDTVTHGMQLWINLPTKHRMSEPGEQVIPGHTAPSFDENGFRGRVFAGTCNGLQGPAKLLTPITFVELLFGAGETTVELPEDERGFLHVIRGTLQLNGETLPTGHSASFTAGTGALKVAASGDGLALLISGRPIDEPVVLDGPFVMNTKEEIAEAYADLQAGKFGAPPITARNIHSP